MRRFEFHRDIDVSGTSGTGVVFEGVEFSDGTVVTRWRPPVSSTCVYASLADLVIIHGHDGAGRVVPLDPLPRREPLLSCREATP